MKNYPVKIYIAGKISGNPNYKEDFANLREWILGKYPSGKILNPASLPEGMTAADYMRICLAMIDSSDLVVFSESANNSKGAILEKEYCKYVGKTYTTIVPREVDVIANCPSCNRTPSIGCENEYYFLIDSDTRCSCCSNFSKIFKTKSDLINEWNLFAAVHAAIKNYEV